VYSAARRRGAAGPTCNRELSRLSKSSICGVAPASGLTSYTGATPCRACRHPPRHRHSRIGPCRSPRSRPGPGHRCQHWRCCWPRRSLTGYERARSVKLRPGTATNRIAHQAKSLQSAAAARAMIKLSCHLRGRPVDAAARVQSGAHWPDRLDSAGDRVQSTVPFHRSPPRQCARMACPAHPPVVTAGDESRSMAAPAVTTRARRLRGTGVATH